MEKGHTIFVGTNGRGLLRSRDGGENWTQIRHNLPRNSQVRALAVYPSNPHRILAGTEKGMFRSEDNGVTWTKLSWPTETLAVYSIGVDPVDEGVIFAGVKPAGVFRSRDDGQTWQRLSLEAAKECYIGAPQVTAITVDPEDHRNIWAGVEIDGVYRSLDGGETWVHLPSPGKDFMFDDIHDMVLQPGRPNSLIISTPLCMFASRDMGESWQPLLDVRRYRLNHARGMAIKADDPSVILWATGEFYSSAGAIQRSTDGGQTWQTCTLPVEPNSTMWAFATHPSDPQFVLCTSQLGEVYSSPDAGESWQKLRREFSEIQSVAWTPN